MGDRCTVSISFGGIITRTVAEGLVNAMDGWGFMDSTWTKPISADDMDHAIATLLENGPTAEEINYGDISEVTNYCQEHGIAYDKWNGAGGDYTEGLERFVGGVKRSAGIIDGEPAIAISRLLKAESLATGLGDLLAEARWWAEPLPAFEIVDGSEAPEPEFDTSDQPASVTG